MLGRLKRVWRRSREFRVIKHEPAPGTLPELQRMIYVAAGDFLPEAHRKFNSTVVLSVILGMAFMLALTRLAPVV